MAIATFPQLQRVAIAIAPTRATGMKKAAEAAFSFSA